MGYRLRKPLPPGGAGWIMLGAALAPVLFRAAKPLTKKLAKGLIKAGEKLRDAVDDAQREAAQRSREPEEPSEQPTAEATENSASAAEEAQEAVSATEPPSTAADGLEADTSTQVDAPPPEPVHGSPSVVHRPKPVHKTATTAKMRKPLKKAPFRAKSSAAPKRVKPVKKAQKGTETAPQEPPSEPSTRFRVPDDLDTA